MVFDLIEVLETDREDRELVVTGVVVVETGAIEVDDVVELIEVVMP